MPNNAINSDVQKRRFALLLRPVMANVESLLNNAISRLAQNLLGCLT